MRSNNPLLARAAAGFGRLLCRARDRGGRVAQCIEALHRGLENVDFDMRRNGELRVLRAVALDRPRCLFDVGANEGQWTLAAAAAAPEAVIHAFEIVPATRDALRRRVGDMPRVRLYDSGLSRTGERIEVHLGQHSCTSTACRIDGMPAHEAYYTTSVQCDTVTGADHMRRNGIGSVDFLKIDVEGMELEVIRGFGDRIRDVKAVQFEYGIFNIASRDLLVDFYRFLAARDFVIGRILPGRVSFGDYHFSMETFRGAYHVAVRRGCRELIDRLSHPWFK